MAHADQRGSAPYCIMRVNSTAPVAHQEIVPFPSAQ